MRKIIVGLVSLLILINLIIVPADAQSEAQPEAQQSIINTSEPSKWQTGSVSSKDNLRRISCFQNKLYVAIGYNGTIFTSPDGVKWAKNSFVSNNVNADLYDVICTDDQIIVVGGKGIVLRSTDGFNWTVKAVTDYSITKVIYGNHLFLAFTNNPGEILTSKDGVSWKRGKTTSKQDIFDAVWNGKVFVTVGRDGEISTSKDGLNWQTKILKSKPLFQKIIWNGKLFVTFGTTSAETDEYAYTAGQYIASSKDGYNWSIKTIKTKSLKKNSPEIYISICNNIIWNGKSFTVFLTEQSGQSPAPDSRLIAYTSNNALDWKRNETNIGGDSFVTVWTGKTYAAVCNLWTLPGYYYRYDVYNSKDGIKWNKVDEQNKEDHKINDIIYCNGKFIIAGDRGEIRSSEDGAVWNNNDVIHYPQLWDGKRFISLDTKTYYLYASIDGLTWEKMNQIDWNITYGPIFWSRKEYITFGPNYYISSSKDLTAWDKTELDSNGILYTNVGPIKAFATDGKKYVLAGSDGTAVSEDLKNWTSRKAKNYYKSVIIGASGFVALNIYGQIDGSADGLKWKRIKIKDYNNSITKIIYAGDKFMGVGDNGEIWYSKDGANWSKADSAANKTLNDICWTGNEFIAAGIEGMVVTSKDGIEWKQEEAPLMLDFTNICSNGEIVLINGRDGFIYKSLK